MNTTSQHADQATSVPGEHSFVTPATKTSSQFIRWLALGTVAGPVLFTLAWLILGEISPGYTAWGVHIAPYSPISQSISGLGLGITAPFMNAAFVSGGILLLIGVVGTFQSIREIGAGARWTCTVLFGLLAVGMAMDGIFTLESGALHFAGFGLGIASAMLGFVAGGLILRRVPSFRRFGTWLLLGCPLTLALTILYFLTFSPTVAGTQTGVAGLTERVLVSEVLAWYATLGWLAFRRA
jgi:hypothetical protein